MQKELTKDEIDFFRIQMLYNISNGWSWYAYKRLGPQKIIEAELEMWKDLMPTAVDLLTQLIDPQGTDIEKAKHVLTQVSKISGYVPEFLEETSELLKWEYTLCPNWDSMIMMNLEDYLSIDGKPAKVSCIHGCTAINKAYFEKINPKFTMQHFKLRPAGDNTCVFQISL